jgi:thioredoxin 1
MSFRNLITSVLLVLFAACNSQNPSVKAIKPAEFSKGMEKDNAQVIDVRTPEEYAEKHLLKSENININDGSFEKRMGELDKDKPLYLYCLSGNRSNRAGNWAVKNGFKEVYNLEGGINAWMGDKLAVVTESGAAPGKGMSFDDYLNHLKASNKLVLVDFNAVWCGPCKILKPIVEKQVKKNADKVELFEIDVDKNPLVSTTMNIRSIPLLLLYKDGKEVWRSMGLIEESVLAAKIKEFI